MEEYMSKFEKKFGKYAISNLTAILIMCYVAGYIIQFINEDLLLLLTLNPYKILRGQIWRLVTWIIVPPSSLGIFTILMLFFYYSIGNALERTWGVYRYNVYIFSGILFTIIASFVAMFICNVMYGDLFATTEVEELVFTTGSTLFSTYYVNMSIMLAFAATFPNAEVLLMYIVPVKMKWMGLIYAGYLLLDFTQGVDNPVYDIFKRCAIAASVVTFVVFWLTSRNSLHMSPAQVKRRAKFHKEVRHTVTPKMSGHKCAICGQTNEDNENLEFRYCSKCNGNYEYCQNHLFTHEHVK